MGIALVGYSMPDLLVGPAADHPVFRHPAMDAGFGAHLADVLLPPVTGFMLIDSLLSGQKGAFASALSHLALPSIINCHHSARRHCAPERARPCWKCCRKLRAHRTRKGACLPSG